MLFIILDHWTDIFKTLGKDILAATTKTARMFYDSYAVPKLKAIGVDPNTLWTSSLGNDEGLDLLDMYDKLPNGGKKRAALMGTTKF